MHREDVLQASNSGCCVEMAADASWAQVRTAAGSLRVVPEIGVDTVDAVDCTASRSRPELLHGGDGPALMWTTSSAQWHKRYLLRVGASHARLSVQAAGAGQVDSLRYLSRVDAKGFRLHNTLTKHFNDHARTQAAHYAHGSPIGFERVVCPEPNSYARSASAPHEYAQISVNADLDYRGGNFMANPGLLAFALVGHDASWALGLAPSPGGYLFSELEYLGGEDFQLRANLWGAVQAEGSFEPPSLLIAPGSGPEGALSAYAGALRALPGHADAPAPAHDWWRQPIVSGWGHQCYQADLFRVRASERPPDNAAYTLCTQLNYLDIARIMQERQVPFGTLIVDARWFQSGGLKDVDRGRWPDLRGFVDAQHRAGRKVLLWWGPWDGAGVANEECVRWFPEDQTQENRPGRLAKFGTPRPGAKLGVDVSLPAVRERVRRQVHAALSSGPGALNADGLKIDHLSAAPGMYGMRFPAGSARLFGIEAARSMQELIYTAAKEAKGDALVLGQSPNPYFAGVQDAVRLGDVYSHDADSVLDEMAFRAAMTRIACPDTLIDTDGWPMPSRRAWREWVQAQPGLGVPSLYYATHLDTTGEELTAGDFADLRRAWAR